MENEIAINDSNDSFKDANVSHHGEKGNLQSDIDIVSDNEFEGEHEISSSPHSVHDGDVSDFGDDNTSKKKLLKKVKKTMSTVKKGQKTKNVTNKQGENVDV